MAIKKILTEPNKILRQVSKPVDKVGIEEQKLMDDMLDTMYDAKGIGLAAIQIGIPKRIIVMDICREENKKEPMFFVNPVIKNKNPEKFTFSIAPFVADEMRLISDTDIPKYLFHRYRYEIFPQLRKLDDYPPYLQIEPSSICNYRCVFCYQTDQGFSEKKSTHMGNMTLEMYKIIIDQAIGKVEFLSLASRGEPLICRDQ